MMSWVLLAMFVGPLPGTGPWTPPKNPDPHAILDEASKDVGQGRHAVALAKLLWFHDNALKYDPHLSAVRLSFALSYWSELAKDYPPALEALKKTRDDALEEFGRQRQDDDGAFDAFQEFESINQHLGEESLTASTFAELSAKRPEAARRVFHVARSALIRAKAYELCGKYVRPAEDWLNAAQLYQIHRGMKEFGPEHTEYLEKSFTNEVATLLALLVVNGRRDEAEQIAQKARLEWDNPAFHAALDSALTGEVPEPWP